MLLYLLQLTREPGSLNVTAMRESLLRAAAPFAQLDESTFVSEVSGSGCLAFTSVGHSPQLVAPRKHVSVRSHVLAAFDGLPLDPRGELCAYDADALIDHWDYCDRLDGQFSAVRVDLENDCFECLTDALSMHPLYFERTGDGWLVGNSVDSIRGVSGASDPDPLGVSSWLTLGWAADYRTLLGSIKALPAAARIEFTRSGMESRQHGGMRALATVSGGPRAAAEETRGMVDAMVALTRAAISGGMPVKCAITGGRDSRTALALCLAAGTRPLTVTIGPPDELDVVIGGQVAGHLGLSHEVSDPLDTPQLEDLHHIVPTFISMVDGLSSLSQLQDIHNLYDQPNRIGVQVWGMGGEIARAGVGPITKFAANGPLFNRSTQFQARMLRAKVRDPLGILTPNASADARDYMDRFVTERRAEGWRPAQIGEVFYAFERIGRWASSGFRRATSHEDLYAPFCTHAFINYAFRMSPGERYAEEAHRRILSDLDPELRDLPYVTPWRAANPRLAWVLSTVDVIGYLGERLGVGERLKRSHSRSASGPRPFAYEWLERHRDTHREICLSYRDSPLFEWVDRAALERAFTIPRYDEVPALEMLRVLTLAWYLDHIRNSGRVAA